MTFDDSPRYATRTQAHNEMECRKVKSTDVAMFIRKIVNALPVETKAPWMDLRATIDGLSARADSGARMKPQAGALAVKKWLTDNAGVEPVCVELLKAFAVEFEGASK